MHKLAPIYSDLADQFLARFPLVRALPRTVGREAEFPVVTAQGQPADVRRLWAELMAPGDLTPKYDSGTANLIAECSGADFSYTIEVGVGTMEINTRPCQTLFEVQQIMEQAVARLVHAAANQGWMVLGYGIQPRSPPSLSIMTPKQRYQSLFRAMGAEWLWYTVTASDQTQLAITRAEAIDLLNFGNLMTPVIIALCANSPVYSGKLSPFCSGREGQHELIRTTEHRHGMPERPFADAYDFVERMAQLTYLIRKQESQVYPGSHPFTGYLEEHGSDFPAFLFHEHYVWNSTRIRANYGTVEIRPACQQPWSQHMAVMALNVGLIEAADAILDYVRKVLGADYWQRMQRYQQQSIRAGLDAPQPVSGFLSSILELASEGLRHRGLGEEELIEPIKVRLYRRTNPAQLARQVFQSDGLNGLLSHAAIRV